MINVCYAQSSGIYKLWCVCYSTVNCILECPIEHLVKELVAVKVMRNIDFNCAPFTYFDRIEIDVRPCGSLGVYDGRVLGSVDAATRIDIRLSSF